MILVAFVTALLVVPAIAAARGARLSTLCFLVAGLFVLLSPMLPLTRDVFPWSYERIFLLPLPPQSNEGGIWPGRDTFPPIYLWGWSGPVPALANAALFALAGAVAHAFAKVGALSPAPVFMALFWLTLTSLAATFAALIWLEGTAPMLLGLPDDGEWMVVGEAIRRTAIWLKWISLLATGGLTVFVSLVRFRRKANT